MIKSIAIVGVIGLDDMVGLANAEVRTTREPLLFKFFVQLMYPVFYYFGGIALRALERKFTENGRA